MSSTHGRSLNWFKLEGNLTNILGDPGRSVGPGEKARRKFSSTFGKAPGYRLSPDHFQTVKRMVAPDYAQKMLCIIVPNRRTVSPEFFSWVRTRRLLPRHSCPGSFTNLVRARKTFIFYFPNQKRRNQRWVEKRFGCYQQEQLNLHWENSVSDGSQCIVSNTFLCRHCTTTTWKCLISRFVKDVNKQWQNSFSSWTWIWLIEIQLQKSSLAFNKVSELE